MEVNRRWSGRRARGKGRATPRPSRVRGMSGGRQAGVPTASPRASSDCSDGASPTDRSLEFKILLLTYFPPPPPPRTDIPHTSLMFATVLKSVLHALWQRLKALRDTIVARLRNKHAQLTVSARPTTAWEETRGGSVHGPNNKGSSGGGDRARPPITPVHRQKCHAQPNDMRAFWPSKGV